MLKINASGSTMFRAFNQVLHIALRIKCLCLTLHISGKIRQMASDSISYTTVVQRFSGNLGLHYINVPDQLALQLSQKFPFRALCTINGNTFHGGMVKHGDDGIVIQMGKATLKKCRIREDDEVTVILAPDKSEYGYEMPEEMSTALELDEEGSLAWENVTPGLKRSYLHYVCSAKTIDTRIKRSLYMIEKIKERHLVKRG